MHAPVLGSRLARHEQLVGWLVLGVAMLSSALLLLHLQQGLTYFTDDLVWLPLSGESLEVLLRPYGGHLILVFLLVIRAVLDLFGLDFTAFGVVQLCGLWAVSALLYVYARRRIGALAALAPATIVLFLG